MHLKLSEFFVHLIQKKSFYGLLAAGLERVSRPGLGTLAVGLREGRAVLYYDPDFIAAIPFKAALFAIEHELLHLVLDHIPRYHEMLALCATKEQRLRAAAVYNIAMDCAINTLLRKHEGFEEAEQFLRDRAAAANPGAPENPQSGMCLPEKWNMPLDESFETYQWLLMQRVTQAQLDALQQGSEHSLWLGENGDEAGDGSGDERQAQAHRIREQLKQALRAAARSAGGDARGLLPGNLAEWFDAYLAPPVIPWWEVFASRAKMSRLAKYQRTVALPNRMLLALAEEDGFIIPTPGRKRDRAWRIFLYVDTSGSMSSESLAIVKSELQHMLAVDENMEIRYMQGDCTTQLDVVLHSGDEIPAEMQGRGGTDFDAYFEHMQQYVLDEMQAPDLVVVYTDGYAPPVTAARRLPPEIPVLWLVTPHHCDRFTDGYGEVLVCDASHNSRYPN